MRSQLIIIICSVIAAIGYVLIGNGLYDEAIKHFSLLLQVCLHPFKLLKQPPADVILLGLYFFSWVQAKNIFPTVFLNFLYRVTQSWSVPSMEEE